MRYSTVEIRPSILNRNEWEVSFSDLDGDRIDEGHRPHGLGFYHYPRKFGRVKAFTILKEYLIRQHEEEITKLQSSLVKLQKLNVIDMK